MDKTTEVRKLPAAAVFKLGQILDTGKAWQKVMAMIPSDPSDLDSEPKYTLQHVKLIEAAGEKQNKSCTEILLDEWGTSGKVRPDLNTLLQILVKAQFYRAAEYVAVDLLKDEPPKRPLHGPAAVVDLPPLSVEDSVEWSIDPDNVSHIPYAVLAALTNDFDDTPLGKCVHGDGHSHLVGHKLGTGAFGTVYYGEVDKGRKLAVKRLSAGALDLKSQFENEIGTLSEYRHPNLVPLLGFSCDTEHRCLVYEFMANGSLLDKLQMKGGCAGFCGAEGALRGGSPKQKPLPWVTRTNIAVDVCEGILFLHTSKKFPLIHRDIKSANILLDHQLRAKVGDFGLVKIKANASESKLLTSTVFGTSAYMAPEAFRGDVSVKMDVFSFGVVLLELLTGLPPYDEDREGRDLVTYIEEVVVDSIEFLLDEKAGGWNASVAREMFALSQACLEEKRSRPLMCEVRKRLGKALWGNAPTAEVTSG